LGADRITISLDEELLAAFDALTQAKGYTNRSEAFRDLIRERLQAETVAADEGQHVVAALTYVYDHHERMLGMRLMDAQHEHHDLSLSTLHVHIGPESCLETTVLSGHLRDVRALANRILAEPGVHFGHLHVIPADLAGGGMHHHEHGEGEGHHHRHPHR
jgi:CopG family transcriptional regulator, nickel-responsive regulator